MYAAFTWCYCVTIVCTTVTMLAWTPWKKSGDR